MMKTFYLQKDERDIIRDIIEYPYEDYIKVQLNTPLPAGVLSGAYKFIEENIIYVPSLDNSELLVEISNLKKQNKELENALIELANLI